VATLLPGASRNRPVRTVKPTKTRAELSTAIFDRLRDFPESQKVTGIVIAPVLRPDSNHPNWHAAFTTGGSVVPRIAWRIGSEIAAEFDLE
jgi:hypothetical protein